MLETIYKGLSEQLGPVGALLLGSNLLVSYGLLRATFFFYSELSKERKKNEGFANRIWELSIKFNQTVQAMNQTIQQHQDKEKMTEVIKSALADFGDKLKS